MYDIIIRMVMANADESGPEPLRFSGPLFDDLRKGQLFHSPSVTLTEGLAAAHQAILGDRLRLPLDRGLSAAVTGGPVAHPGLIADLAIGQSTVVTHRVRANLFYRGLRFHHFPFIGDTLTTRTEVVGLKQNRHRTGRPPTGLAVLRMTTSDQDGRTVLDFHRCAMLPRRSGQAVHAAGSGADTAGLPHDDEALHDDDPAAIGTESPAAWATPRGWDLGAYPSLVPGADEQAPPAGTILRSSADVVSSAPELARLTLNIAEAHHDHRAAGGRRLVYGGHAIGLALSQATRMLPTMLTVLGWRSCDHTGPVYEGDTLSSDVSIGPSTRLDGGGAALELRSLVRAHRPAGDVDVLDWAYTVLMPS